MENLEETKQVNAPGKKTVLSDAELDAIFSEPKKSWLTRRLAIRLAGLFLLVIGLGLMILWQRTGLPDAFRTLAFILSALGFIIYFTGRALEFTAALKKKKT